MVRQRKRDTRHIAIRLGAAFIFCLVFAGVWLSKALPGDWFNRLVKPVFPLLLVALLLGFVVAIWPFPYWCPRCRTRLRISQEKRPMHLYHCPACDIEWDLGSSDAD